MSLMWRKIHFGRLLASGLIYRLFVILVQTTFFWILTGKFVWSLGVSMAWNAVNMLCYYLFHTILLKMVRFGKSESDEVLAAEAR